jgi:Ca2+-binding RTX toxin-like protein
MGRGRPFAVAAGFIGIALFLPALAYAGTATSDGLRVQYLALKGEANDVTVSFDASEYVITDVGARVDPGEGCRRVTRDTVRCDALEGHVVVVKTRDRNDVVHLDVPVQASIWGARGADHLVGGSERDLIVGGGGADLLEGGGDWDDLLGGPGPDDLRGGPGIRDRVSYSEREAAVKVTLDGLRNDGEPGENDLVANDVEDVSGGAGPDIIVGDANSNLLEGGAGNDRFDGRSGGDIFFGGDGFDTLTYASRTAPVSAGWTSYCDSGEVGEADCITQSIERVVGGSGNDVLVANAKDAGRASLVGGLGNDFLIGGSHFATVRFAGGAGDDTLQSDNGLSDVYFCGSGTDSVSADTVDTVAADCEDVDRSA